MIKLPALLTLTFMMGCAGLTVANPPADHAKMFSEVATLFETTAGDTVQAFEGSLRVPENRNAADSRMITLKYIRFPATGENPGSPIIYLAGGPGGSGINAARHERFPLFMAMREFGDVIAFDQRGTGASNDMENCTSSQQVSTTEPTSDAVYFDTQRAAFKECLQIWTDQGIDVRGYTTTQSVLDLNDLRQSLGAEKISLWGISYGSHLSLAALQQIDAHLDKVVIAAVEGLDQTVKQPARTDQYFERLQAAINTDPETKAKYPDVRGLISGVLADLEKTPLLVEIPLKDGGTAPYLVQKRDMQTFTSALSSDPARITWILGVHKALADGNSEPLVDLLQKAIDPTQTAVSMRTMGTLMDVASGSSDEYRAMVIEQAKTSLLGLHTNFSHPLETVDPSLDLGATFRMPPVSDVPTLLLSGSLDGRTYPESGQDATASLSNRETVNVINGGHNLFMLSPEVQDTILTFMRGQSVDGRDITVSLPKF